MEKSSRILSIDFFRGLTMLLLVAETTGLYNILGLPQLHHHPWHGLRFWDLIQPFFMFIVGVAMPFSLANREARGISYGRNWRHIVVRCAVLLLMGAGLQCAYSGRLVWELWNVLAQLSVTILIAYALMKQPIGRQLAASLILVLASDFAYRFFPIAGFDQPFVKDHNFGSWVDMLLMGKLNPGGGWVAVNCIPTAAHTIWGVVAGLMLKKVKEGKAGKVKTGALTGLQWLAVGGVVLLALGYGLDAAGVSPIIKRICTTSFIFASGGWAVLALALCYWLIDVRGWHRATPPFAAVGMNCILIYLLTQTIGEQWFNGFVRIFAGGFSGMLGASGYVQALLSALTALGLEWALCWFLYRKKVFVKV